MKNDIVDYVGYVFLILMVMSYRHLILIPERHFYLQYFGIYALILIGFIVYKTNRKYSKQATAQLQTYYLLAICIVAFALGGFSQSELQQLHFNFSDNPDDAIQQYLELKTLFYALGIILLPKLLKQSNQHFNQIRGSDNHIQ
ncbi:hypothetical protein [Pasteurella testudinis]|uniref:hypothetical protein n=1 Tax=Pasteurella testudinis TaxID=761 RepID=UPI000E1C243B|nr:hypothetical protein [Pasteurella testudinis]